MLDDPEQSVMNKQEINSWKTFLRARSSPTHKNIDQAVAALSEQRRQGIIADDELVSNLALLGRPATALAFALNLPPQQDTDFWFSSFLGPLRADPRFILIARYQRLLAVWRATNLWPDFCHDGSVPYDCHKVADGLGTGRAE